ncbi:hypothetical protein SD37_11865 [Amycolatopsis orientalis]|uniref:DUF397 domain-containing protein n=1 Tax=Amycolatopsis orientalis TaxID=31958 RepID=A0A193BVS0_AMYOR|nr:DUF397 domain-containing protein [Amycolatopsis orientalis]ANN16275.1 hypothetical protein SD37_11865 [Amycolatopsis orientalis]
MRIREDADDWRISTYSKEGENCVEVALGPVTRIRDTKDRAGGELSLPAAAWTQFLKTVIEK